MEENFVFGRNAVLELLKNDSRKAGRIMLMRNMHPNAKINEIISIAKSKGIIFQFLPKEKFLKFKDIPHQGVIAYASPVKCITLEDFLTDKKKYKKMVITDGIQDPQNMGSIIRTAVCAGFDAIMFPSRRNAPISAAAEKSSAGALNRIDLIMVNSLSASITKLKDNDFWIIASDLHAEDNYYDIDYCDMNFAIVIGAEKNGVSSAVLKNADYRVKIPMISGFNSLNAANAASIIIFESVKQIIQKSADSV